MLLYKGIGKGVELGLNIYFAGSRRISFKIFSQLGAVDIYFMLFMKKITHFLFFSRTCRGRKEKSSNYRRNGGAGDYFFSDIVNLWGDSSSSEQFRK